MKLSSSASINEDRGSSTSENNRKNSPHTVKPNTVNQPSNTSNHFHSLFHPFPSSDANGILEHTIHTPTDRTALDLTSEIPHHSRTRHNSPSHSRSSVPSSQHHSTHIHPPSDFKEIRSNSKLRASHYLPHSSPFIQPNIAKSEPILDNDDDESAKKKNRRYLDSLHITPAPDSKQISERSSTTQNIKYSHSRRQHTVDYTNQSPNRPQSVDNNLSIVYSRNPRTPAKKISITNPFNSCIEYGTLFHLKSSTI